MNAKKSETRGPGSPGWKPRERSQRNKIVTAFLGVQGTLTATLVGLVSAGAVDPVTGLLVKGGLEAATAVVNVLWQK